MIIARPTVTEERALTLAARYPALRAAVEATGQGGSWKTTTWLARCLGFVLGLIGASLLGGVLRPFPSRLLVGGLLLLAAAEWLIARRHMFRSGIEEALYLCGAVAIVVQLLAWSDGNNTALGVALIATAVLLAGWRLLNPLFTTLAAIGYSLAIALFDATLFGGRLNTTAAAIACSLVAILALAAGGRIWLRPSHDRMLDGLVIVMPWLGYSWLSTWVGYEGTPAPWIWLLLALGFLVVNVATGLRRRTHAPLIGALGNLACAFHALFWLLHWPTHWRLIAGGAVLRAAAILLDRLLRDRGEGITSRAIEEPSGLDLVQIAAAAHIAPAAGSPPATASPGVQGQGGEFGGGGASGRF